MTTTQAKVEAFLICGGSLLWTVIWAYIWFMLLRMLRWKYLEMKYAPQWAAQPQTPPAPVWTP